MLNDKILLITGGTGSFGNAVLERMLQTELREIRIFSRDEKKQDDMRRKYQNDRIKYYIGDIRDVGSLESAIYGVDYIFNAAALKQVPSCEFFPIEAVKTNVLGTDNVLTVAIRNNIKKIVCLSTDKAAYPINAMGISKAMMEKVFIAKSRTVSSDQTIICGTRYGNVMCSRGSVIPLFIEQIKAGVPLTVTDPRMSRFIMSLEESVDLVLYAFEHANSGDLMVQKAASCYIGDLAQAMKELFGVNNETKIIGIRHGEKMYEVLMTQQEASRAQDMENFFRIPADNRDLNYEKYLDKGFKAITDACEFTSENAKILNVEEIKEKLIQTAYVRAELNAWVHKK